MSSTPIICYCGGSSTTTRLPEDNNNNNSSQYDAVCQVCSSLSSRIARYHAAKNKHEELKKECHQRLLDTRLPPPTAAGIITTSTTGGDNNEHTTENSTESISKRQQLPDPNQVSSQVLHLKHKLQCLRSTSNELAVRLTAKTMENDERESQLQFNATKIQLARERLEVMRRCLLVHSEEGAPTNSNKLEEGKCSTDSGGNYQIGGGLKDALVTGTKQIQTLRFQYACKVFDMHKIDVGEQYTNNHNKKNENKEHQHSNNNSNLSATGVGKIGNLPLPHAGPVLYGVVPRMVLASSLRWVASLTQLVARCLGVVLPHPILVCFKECRQCGCMYDFTSDVIDNMLDDADSDDEYCDQHDAMICSACLNEGHQNTATTTTIKQQSMKPLTSSTTSTQPQRRSSLLKLVGKSARKAISLTTSATSRAISQYSSSSSSIDLDQSVMSSHVQQQQRSSYQQSKTHSAKSTTNNGVVSMSLESLSKRINHANFAYLRESHDASATEYVLDPPRWNDEGSIATRSSSSNNGLDDANDSERGVDSMNNAKRTHTTFNTREEFHIAEERFATGLQLLQNNVLSLCFRVGVRIDTLWPAESMLLNLNSLWIHCQKMAEEAV